MAVLFFGTFILLVVGGLQGLCASRVAEQGMMVRRRYPKGLRRRSLLIEL